MIECETDSFIQVIQFISLFSADKNNKNTFLWHLSLHTHTFRVIRGMQWLVKVNTVWDSKCKINLKRRKNRWPTRMTMKFTIKEVKEIFGFFIVCCATSKKTFISALFLFFLENCHSISCYFFQKIF
jgi:hypothetical protein